MWQKVSTQQIFIIVINFINHFKMLLGTIKSIKLLGQILIMLNKIVSVDILNAIILSFDLGSNLFFINIEQNIFFQANEFEEIEAWC